MRALTWQGKGQVNVRDVTDPRIEEPTDAVVRVTSTAICGSDLHLYDVLAPYLTPGDILGHEFMGVVEEVGSDTGELAVGDRVVVPFNISCGHCWMCTHGLQSQCETTQVTEQGKGARLFGYTSLYGAVPGGQAEYARVPQAQYGPIRIAPEGPDERYLYLSDILPTAWQGVQYADLPRGGTLLVIGLGPVGQLATRVGQYLGAGRVIGVDLVPERLAAAAAHGVETVDLSTVDDLGDAVLTMTGGRGADSVIDAVGMEAHGNPVAEVVIGLASSLPKPVARAATDRFGIDRLAALYASLAAVRRGGTVSLLGVYGGMADPMPMMEMFDKQVTLRMGQANVRRWSDELVHLLRQEEDVFDVEGLATHHLPLEAAADAYEMFKEKRDGCIKVVLRPGE
ncbi:MAG: zinc-dependent alcohol dehydrogenase [Lapillicoccus sp.]